MGFWSTLGKIGVNAAPYVAAPFTGGASLAFAPMANKIGSKIGPDNTKLDGFMGGVANVAGAYGGSKLAGKMGGTSGGGLPIKANDGGYLPMDGGGYPGSPGFAGGMFGGSGGNQGGGVGGFLQQLMQSYGQGGQQGGQQRNGFLGNLAGMFGAGRQQSQMGVGPLNNESYQQSRNPNSMGMGPRFDASNPNLADPIMRGRNEAIMNQPWRNQGNAGGSMQPMNIMPNVPIGPRNNPMAQMQGYM